MVYGLDDVGELSSRGLKVKVNVVYDEILMCGL